MTTLSSLDVMELFSDAAKPDRSPMAGAAQMANVPLTSFSFGLADPTMFPREEMVDAVTHIMANDGPAALNYGVTHKVLVDQIIERLARQGVTAKPEQVLVTYGSGQLLGLLPRVFVNPGDVVIIEGPTFMGSVRHFQEGGANLYTVPVDDQGLDVDALEKMLAELKDQGIRPKFIYTIPTFHNPSGVTMTLERRKRLIELASAYSVLIVEDDAYYDLRFTGEPLPTLAALDPTGSLVLRLCTFSKILAPGIRVGWAYGHPEIIKRLLQMRSEGNHNPFVTRIVSKFSENGHLDEHIAALNERYSYKAGLMYDAIQKHFPADVKVNKPEGGFFIWCKLPSDISATKLLAECEANHGITFLPGTRCYANGQGDDEMRLSFSFLSPEQITDGIAKLGKAMEIVRGK
jgi:2-aminoadipate transaminase